MSGTSMDGIDLALIETDGEGELTRLGGLSKPYTDDLRAQVSHAVHLVQNASLDEWPYNQEEPLPSAVLTLEEELVSAHAAMVLDLLKSQGLTADDIELIGYHGQTLIHRPDIGFTYQLANGAALASQTGMTVVNDLRVDDMRRGGEGAPLAPIYHKCLITKFIADNKLRDGPHVFVNIGGVSNVTFIDERGGLLAFDTGPGNALLDDWVRELSGQDYDEGGALSLLGTADELWCLDMLQHPYFEHRPPKSIDRDMFAGSLSALKERNLSLEDGAATLVSLTARSIACAATFFDTAPLSWVIGGGGRHNRAIIKELQREVSGDVIISDDLGIDGDLIEAECFAYLAVRARKNLPITFPGTTGVDTPLSGGVIHGV